jgi:cell division protein FtsW
LATLALICLGVVMVYSTYGALRGAEHWYQRGDARAAIFAGVAVLIIFLVCRMDYHWLMRPFRENGRITPALLLLGLGLLASVAVLVPHVGSSVGGRARWLKIGPIGFQPSELLRFALLIFLAAFLSKKGRDSRSFWKVFVPLMILIGGACALVAKEKFASAGIIGIAAMGLLLMAGVPWYYLLLTVPFVAFGFHHFVMHDPDRWARITAVMNPFNFADASTYQQRQALIAIGNGLDPSGPGGGIAKFGYLPEADTDFMFSIICEELGALGSSLVVGLLLVWLLLARRAASHAADRFGALLAGGLGFVIILQAVMHIAVNLACFPPTGVCLPFVSSGGTSLLTNAAAAAILISIPAFRSSKAETANGT